MTVILGVIRKVKETKSNWRKRGKKRGRKRGETRIGFRRGKSERKLLRDWNFKSRNRGEGEMMETANGIAVEQSGVGKTFLSVFENVSDQNV